MVSSSNDIRPTPEGTKLRDHVISSRAHGCKDGRLRGELPLFAAFFFQRICPFITILYPHKAIG